MLRRGEGHRIEEPEGNSPARSINRDGLSKGGPSESERVGGSPTPVGHEVRITIRCVRNTYEHFFINQKPGTNMST